MHVIRVITCTLILILILIGEIRVFTSSYDCREGEEENLRAKLEAAVRERVDDAGQVLERGQVQRTLALRL